MSTIVLNPQDMGLEVVDLETDPLFAQRQLHSRDAKIHLKGMQRLAEAFVESPDTILQELVNAAVEFCGADSSGISIEREDKTDESYYLWAATAGQYSSFRNAVLPRFPSACGVCLERGKPQLFRVGESFFDLMGVEAPIITDGILLPWQVEEMRGTIWIVAHGRSEAFDIEDYRMMQLFANFAAMGVRQNRQHRLLVEQARAAAEAEMANQLAHKINNPLQCLTNLVYLSLTHASDPAAKLIAENMSDNLSRLSTLVGELLALPCVVSRSK